MESQGKLLIVETTVSDVSLMTNKMSIILRLSGGQRDKKVVSLDAVDKEGDSIFFQTFILFKE